MDFLILRPLRPKAGYHLFGGGWVGWGGVKSFRSTGFKQPGSPALSHQRRSHGNAPDAKFAVGGSNPGLLTFSGGGGVKFSRPGFEPPTQGISVGCITIRPLLDLKRSIAPLLGDASATDKKPKMCASVCLTAGLA